MKKLLRKIAIVALSSIPLTVQTKDTSSKGYEIYESEYISTLLIGDIKHDYIGTVGNRTILWLQAMDGEYLDFTISVKNSGSVDGSFKFESPNSKKLIDWEATKIKEPEAKELFLSSNIPIYFTKPLKSLGVSRYTKYYLATTSPAQAFAGGYDGFIPSFYYTSISGNKTYISNITSLSSLIAGRLWQSGDVSSLGIEKNDFIIQNYYVSASVEDSEQIYDVYLWAFAKSKDDKKVVDLNIAELGHVDLHRNIRKVGSYTFPQPVPTLTTEVGYYNIIRSGGAYGLTDSIKNYEEGYKDGQGNPTFKSFIVTAFEACSAFFALPVLGQNITIGTLIGSFIGLGALFLIIKLFR